MLRAASRTRWVLALAAYSLLAIVLTWPLAARLSDVFPNDPGDPVLNTWILWWNAHHVPLTAAWWDAPFFWPVHGALALSEHLLGLSLIATPLQWLGADPATAYNILFLLSFPLSALAAHALAFTLTERHDAGAVAGLVYGFNPYRAAQLAHIQVLASWWLPLALVGLHQYLRRRDTRWLVLFAISWLMSALSNGYYMLFLPILIALWVLWFVPIRPDARALAAIVASAAVGTIPLLPIVWKYRRIHLALGLQRQFSEILSFSPDLTGVLDASPFLKFWNLTQFHKGEGEMFPGSVAIVLLALPIASGAWRLVRRGRSSKTAIALLYLAVAAAAVGLSAVIVGPWAIVIGRFTLLSVGVVKKPLSIAIVLSILALIFDPRVNAAIRRRSVLLFYVLATLLLYLLAFGPEPQLLGHPILYRAAPYEWLMRIPGFDTARVPSRFVMVALVAMSTAAGLVFSRLVDGRTPRQCGAIAAAICGGILADSWIGTLPLPPRPPRVAALEAVSSASVVLEMPMNGVFHETAAMYRSMYHRLPLVNGYSGFFPKHYDILSEAMESGDPDAIDAAASSSAPLVVVLDTRADDGSWTKFFETDRGTTALGREGDLRVFSVKRPPAPAPRAHGSPLRVASISASAHSAFTGTMTDGDVATVWHTEGPQAPGDLVTVDLGAERSVDGLSLALGASFLDYPRDFTIHTSVDGATWVETYRGRGLTLAVDAARRDPVAVPLVVAFAPTPARWIRIRQGGAHKVFWWSIAELQVFGR